MIDQGLSFHEGAAPSGHVNCSRCGTSVTEYWAVDGAVLCERCKGEVLLARESSDGRGGRIIKALALGTGGALAGAAVWYAVAKFAHLELALIAILLAWLVGKGVFLGSGKRGGRGYQVMAVALTWFGIGAAAAPFQFEGFAQQAAQVVDSMAMRDTSVTAPTAPMSDSQVNAELAKLDSAIAKPPSTPAAPSGVVVILLGLGALLLLIVSLPVLVIINSGSVILVIIYAVGLFEAWKLTRRVDPLVSGPHAVGMH